MTLQIVDVTAGYKPSIDILSGLSLETGSCAVTSVVGVNGAGKSTTLKAAAGLLRVTSGKVNYRGQDITRWSAHQRKMEGLSFVPQHNSTFPQLTVEQNLRLGAWLIRKNKAKVRSRLTCVYETFPALYEKRRMSSQMLSGAQLRALSVAKELMVPSQTLMLDEPSTGLSPNLGADLSLMTFSRSWPERPPPDRGCRGPAGDEVSE